MFLVAFAFFLVFTILYVLFSAAIIYHLRQYTLTGYPAPRVVVVLFCFISSLFWLFALTFLIKIPR